jgi:hypothetical protein
MRRGESEVASAPNTHRGIGRKAARHGPVQRTLGVANAFRHRAGQAKTWRCPPDQQTSHVMKVTTLVDKCRQFVTRESVVCDPKRNAARDLRQPGRASGGSVRSRRARRRLAALPRQRGAPDAGTIPRKQNDRKRACGRLQISLACPERSVSCSQLIQSGRIVPQVPSGATMPHAALGAVGEHGCRRRA